MSDYNVLFTSAGRRVALVRLFRAALNALDLPGTLVTADLLSTAPARFAGDMHELVPRVSDPQYVDRLRELCEAHRIRLVVPLIDTELPVLAAHRDTLASAGAKVLVPSLETVEIAADKRVTASFFAQHDIPGPRLLEAVDVLAGRHPFPVFLKPAFGSASQGVHRIDRGQELRHYLGIVPDAMLQEYIEGTEYTVDVLIDFEGSVRSVVPRRRIETRAGEVSKGVTERNEDVIAGAVRVAEALPGASGVITLQCFVTPDGAVVFFEINPRFGGGFPLSAAAGADFPRWIIEWGLGRDPEIGMSSWQDGLYMLRYDEAFYVKHGDLG